MRVKFLKAPFPHLLIKNTFTKSKYNKIYDEILEVLPRAGGPEKTGASVGDSIIRFVNCTPPPPTYNKKGNGIFLDSIPEYLVDRSKSKILTYTKEIFSDKVIKAIQKDNCLFKYYYLETTNDWTLLQSYGEGDYYNSHADAALFTSITLIHKEPKKYTGGELIFPEFEYNPKIENNQTIIFPSQIVHKVTTVNKETKDVESNRFTITKFLHYAHL